jgi:hypothetical protein
MITLALITLLLGPWRGPSLPTASADAVKYKLAVRGPAERAVHLRAEGLPKGWIASFCTEKICSPFSYTLNLNDRGQGDVEFQAIRTDDAAPAHARVTITADGSTSRQLNVTAH